MTTDSHDRVRLGVIGAGRIAQVAHLTAIEKVDRIQLVAISDPSDALSGGVAKRYGITGFTDSEAMLASDLDAVLIATPDRFHYTLGELALRAGKHVLMEKPLAATSEEAQALTDLARESGLVLQTGAMKRHDPGMVYAKQNIERLGRIHTFSSWYRVHSALRTPVEETLFPSVIVDSEVRAVETGFKSHREKYLLVTHGAHLFDGLRYFAGDLDWVSAHLSNIGEDYTWHGIARITSGGGLVGFEITASVHGRWAEGTDVYGEFGHISTRTPLPFYRQQTETSVFVESEGIATSPTDGRSNAYERQLEHFAAVILDAAPENPSPEDGVSAVRMIEAVYESVLAGGRKIALR